MRITGMMVIVCTLLSGSTNKLTLSRLILIYLLGTIITESEEV